MKDESDNSQNGGIRASRSRSRGRGSRETGSLGMSLKPLFIDDPDTAKDINPERLSDQELVEKYKREELSTKERIMEFFSSHPNIAKRLQALGCGFLFYGKLFKIDFVIRMSPVFMIILLLHLAKFSSPAF
ncbi:hypothetical protein AKJ66_01115 [candidate division MSBL1 archaeon SCGC-AAA259E22]|uniref:Peptidase M48 domain-containing protein n=1 Tax=candidate division MSBL1 archaeon SCGC-AAA259E22 TaxID=1698265 RepID=A0A133UHR4_9EURY|nr:hypothetical protein AKJ66_01115 [candidate division MSBL1 archaeon SCGC-AAA259E22]